MDLNEASYKFSIVDFREILLLIYDIVLPLRSASIADVKHLSDFEKIYFSIRHASLCL